MTEIKTQYLPADWLDEVTPDRGDHPDAFLFTLDGCWFLKPIEDDFDECSAIPLSHGETVSFCEFRDHGSWTISIREERDHLGHPVWTGAEMIPAEANCFASDDLSEEDICDTPQGIVDGLFNFDRDIAGDIEIWAYHWSDGAAWLFEVVDGKGRFRKVELSS